MNDILNWLKKEEKIQHTILDLRSHGRKYARHNFYDLFKIIRSNGFAVLSFHSLFRAKKNDHFYKADFLIWACSDVQRHERVESN